MQISQPMTSYKVGDIAHYHDGTVAVTGPVLMVEATRVAIGGVDRTYVVDSNRGQLWLVKPREEVRRE